MFTSCHALENLWKQNEMLWFFSSKGTDIFLFKDFSEWFSDWIYTHSFNIKIQDRFVKICIYKYLHVCFHISLFLWFAYIHPWKCGHAAHNFLAYAASINSGYFIIHLFSSIYSDNLLWFLLTISTFAFNISSKHPILYIHPSLPCVGEIPTVTI